MQQCTQARLQNKEPPAEKSGQQKTLPMISRKFQGLSPFGFSSCYLTVSKGDTTAPRTVCTLMAGVKPLPLRSLGSPPCVCMRAGLGRFERCRSWSGYGSNAFRCQPFSARCSPRGFTWQSLPALFPWASGDATRSAGLPLFGPMDGLLCSGGKKFIEERRSIQRSAQGRANRSRNRSPGRICSDHRRSRLVWRIPC